MSKSAGPKPVGPLSGTVFELVELLTLMSINHHRELPSANSIPAATGASKVDFAGHPQRGAKRWWPKHVVIRSSAIA
jgi:hypothetical protein